jgi:hypothetical protein
MIEPIEAGVVRSEVAVLEVGGEGYRRVRDPGDGRHQNRDGIRVPAGSTAVLIARKRHPTSGGLGVGRRPAVRSYVFSFGSARRSAPAAGV